MTNWGLIGSFLTSALIAWLVTPVVIKLAWKINLIDDPRKNKQPKVTHQYPVPRGGGLATFIAIFVSSLLFLPADRYLAAILAGAALITSLGLLDDKFNLNPYLRIITQIIILLIPALAGIDIKFLTNPLKGGAIDFSSQTTFNLAGQNLSIPAIFLTIIWIFVIMNVVNMGAKGIDGQMPGVVVIAALTIAFLSLRFSADITQWPVIILALITAGAYLGFLPWNFYPQKIMPSYSGSTLAGYMLAILSILSTTKVGTLLVVLGVPIVDTTYVIIGRLVHGKSPVWGDRTHLHHRLLDIGWGKRKIAVFYWLTTAFLGFLALNLNHTHKVYTIVGVAIFVWALILWTKNLSPKRH